MKRLLLPVCGLFALTTLHAQRFQWQPSAGHKQIPIWSGAAPDSQLVRGPEYAEASKNSLVAGRPLVWIGDVTRPTLTVYSPTKQNTGAAVVVFPGGGYQILAIDLEGTEACDWLTTHGITCVLLKYRVTDVGAYPKSGPYPEASQALEDAQRTMGLVRLHAAEWHIDPHKIGVMGFSAGGHLVAAISACYQKRLYPPVDSADKESCRPDFAVALYPGHMSLSAADWDAKQGKKKFAVPQAAHPSAFDSNLEFNPFIHFTPLTPPTFIVESENDHVDSVYDALAYYVALQKAGVPVEMHLYAQGGHAFGLRHTDLPITDWPDLMDRWLRTIGMISQ
jgi:acetyl esterase/lipase